MLFLGTVLVKSLSYHPLVKVMDEAGYALAYVHLQKEDLIGFVDS